MISPMSMVSLVIISSLLTVVGSTKTAREKGSFSYSVSDSSSSSSSSDWNVRLKRSEDWSPSSAKHEEQETFLNEVDISEEAFNQSLKRTHRNYSTNGTFDHHKYYKSRIYYNANLWVDLDKLNETNVGIVHEHSMLSKSYRHAATISLTFQFPFYGHFVRNITIATGGFLYTGEYVHSWLAATQYIAPLMANFDTSQHESAKIRYADNGTALIVEWNDVYLKSSDMDSNSTEAGPFTFQVIIHENGNIIFAYKTIPIIISTIEDKVHPVKVGLSDAYIIDRTIFYVRRKTIYEYHRVNLKDALINNSSAIFFSAIPTCNIQQTCETCLSSVKSNSELEFECFWCQSLNRCSDGMDRFRQSWLRNNCDKFRVAKREECSYKPSTYSFVTDSTKQLAAITEESDDDSLSQPQTSSDGTIATIVVFLLLVLLLMLWAAYAYFYPHTWSGQFLIKYRPTRWHWRSSEARYTPASIHM